MVDVLTANIFQETRCHVPKQRYVIWIDGIGAYLICLGDSVGIGGPVLGEDGADISLLANLSRLHATILRSGEHYLLQPYGTTTVMGKSCYEPAILNAESEIGLGDSVRLRFDIPMALSTTARLEFQSHHRPALAVDGVLLFKDNCVMGPQQGSHIHCPTWSQSVVLFHKDDQFWCRTHNGLVMDGTVVSGAAPIPEGSVVTGMDIQFRIEAVG
ncbi:MAG: hypothetical protein ABGZ17_21865 [Planctomycetaceae bacterium]